MLILLPPSETKRDGGTGSPLALSSLRFPSLLSVRESVLQILQNLSDEEAVRALKLGPKQMGELSRNTALLSSPTMPAIARYTGVLYEPFASPNGEGTLDFSESEWRFVADHVVVQSALFGLISGTDLIPAYRLSGSSRLPGLSLKRAWSEPGTEALRGAAGFVIDLRSRVYVELSPLPVGGGVYVSVVQEQPGGGVRALNHFNKKAKGEFARALISSGIVASELADLNGVAATIGFALVPTGAGTADLVLPVGYSQAKTR